VLQLSQRAGLPIGDLVAAGARRTAEQVLGDAPVALDVVVIDRAGAIVGRA
ncbi:MAG: cobalt-precorrin-5B (C1)-methyltransferase, partial [Pseudonocardiales bacterium]|nr:cobalt-precorrin-5B (C1)-methyltransferase [Pseudonocardiales bacterium]